MFGRKSKVIKELTARVKELSDDVDALMIHNNELAKIVGAQAARLDDIQNKSNARTRKCRQKKKLLEQAKKA